MEVDGVTPASSPPKSSKSAESSAGGIMAAPGTQGSVAIALHPLVIMNVSEHWTRTKAQNGSPQLGSTNHFHHMIQLDDSDLFQ